MPLQPNHAQGQARVGQLTRTHQTPAQDWLSLLKGACWAFPKDGHSSCLLGLYYSLPEKAATGIQVHLTYRETEAGGRWQPIAWDHIWETHSLGRIFCVPPSLTLGQTSLTDLLFAHALTPAWNIPPLPHSHPHLANSDPIPQLAMPPPGSPPCPQVELEASWAPSPPPVLPLASCIPQIKRPGVSQADSQACECFEQVPTCSPPSSSGYALSPCSSDKHSEQAQKSREGEHNFLRVSGQTNAFP